MKSSEIVVGEFYAVAYGRALPDARFPVGAQSHLVTRVRVLYLPRDGRVHVRVMDARGTRFYTGSDSHWLGAEKRPTLYTSTRRVLMPWKDFAAEAATAKRMSERAREDADATAEEIDARLNEHGLVASVCKHNTGVDHLGIHQYAVVVYFPPSTADRLVSGAAGVTFPERAFTERVPMSAAATAALLDAFEARAGAAAGG